MDLDPTQSTGGGFEPSWKFNLGLALGGFALFTGALFWLISTIQNNFGQCWAMRKRGLGAVSSPAPPSPSLHSRSFPRIIHDF